MFIENKDMRSYVSVKPQYGRKRRRGEKGAGLLLCALLTVSGAAAQTPAPVNTVPLPAGSLMQYPAVVMQGLTQALLRGDAQGVRVFLPVYRAQHPGETMLSRWGGAFLAAEAGQYRQAVRLYRALTAEYPDLPVLRFQMAVALAENQENDSALSQFQRLRSVRLPFGLNAQTEAYIARIQARDNWNIRLSLSYLDESNLNNAPPPGTAIGRWQAGKPESGRGVSYGVSADKRWSYGDGVFGEYRFTGQAEQFWDNHRYDRFTVRNAAGAGWRDVNTGVAVLPFVQQEFYGGGRYREHPGVRPESVMPGVMAEGHRFLSPQWRIYGQAEYGVKRYREKAYLNGERLGVSGTVFYLFSPQQYVFGGVRYHRENARSPESANTYYGVRAGWGDDWQYGLSWRIQGQYGIRQYDGADFFGIRARSSEMRGSVTLWSRNVYLLGVTPKVSWIYSRTASNHPFYGLEKSQIVWHLSREF